MIRPPFPFPAGVAAAPPDFAAIASLNQTLEALPVGVVELLSIAALGVGLRALRRILGPYPRRLPLVRRVGRMRPGVWGYR